MPFSTWPMWRWRPPGGHAGSDRVVLGNGTSVDLNCDGITSTTSFGSNYADGATRLTSVGTFHYGSKEAEDDEYAASWSAPRSKEQNSKRRLRTRRLTIRHQHRFLQSAGQKERSAGSPRPLPVLQCSCQLMLVMDMGGARRAKVRMDSARTLTGSPLRVTHEMGRWDSTV